MVTVELGACSQVLFSFPSVVIVEVMMGSNERLMSPYSLLLASYTMHTENAFL